MPPPCLLSLVSVIKGIFGLQGPPLLHTQDWASGIWKPEAGSGSSPQASRPTLQEPPSFAPFLSPGLLLRRLCLALGFTGCPLLFSQVSCFTSCWEDPSNS